MYEKMGIWLTGNNDDGYKNVFTVNSLGYNTAHAGSWPIPAFIMHHTIYTMCVCVCALLVDNDSLNMMMP